MQDNESSVTKTSIPESTKNNGYGNSEQERSMDKEIHHPNETEDIFSNDVREAQDIEAKHEQQAPSMSSSNVPRTQRRSQSTTKRRRVRPFKSIYLKSFSKFF